MNNLLWTRFARTAAALMIALATLGSTAGAQEHYASQTRTPSDTDDLRAAQMLVLGQDAQGAFARQIQAIGQLRDDLRSGDGFLRNADETTLHLILDRDNARAILAQAYAREYGSSIAPTAPALAAIDRAIDELWDDVTRLAPGYESPEGRAVSSKLNSALAASLRAAVPNADYVTARLTDTAWTIEANKLSVPVARSLRGVVYYRVPGNPLVVCREVSIRRPYFEKPAAGSPGDVSFGSIRLQSRVE